MHRRTLGEHPLLPLVVRVFLGVSRRVGKDRPGVGGQGWPENWRTEPAPAREADQGSVLGFVLERELNLGAVGDRPAFVHVNVQLNDLSHPKIADCPGCRLDRLRCRLFP